MSLATLHVLANVLSIITIAPCLILKVPQIMKLLDNKSAVGISFTSLVLELTSYTIMTSYNYTSGYSVLTYVEYPIILIQEYILIYIVLKYLNLVNNRTLLAVFLYSVIFTSLLTEVIPKITLTILAPLCTPISASSKIVQLMAILRAKNADAVSPKTWFISAFTNLTRAFTVWIDSADKILLANLLISTTLSSSVMFAALHYKTKAKKS